MVAAGSGASPAAPISPLFFLDTNSMHYGSLLLRFARDAGLWPFSPHTGSEHLLRVLQESYVGRTLDSFMNGLRLVQFLRERCDEGARIEYCPITNLELMCGRLRGRAIEIAAQEGIPYRLWSPVEEREILGRLNREIYRDVHEDTATIEELFQNASVALSQTDPERIRDIWTLTSSILGIIYIDAPDCMVYSSALLAEANVLITYDAYLRYVAHAIENPAGIANAEERLYFADVRTRLVDLVSTALGIAAVEVELPTAQKV